MGTSPPSGEEVMNSILGYFVDLIDGKIFIFSSFNIGSSDNMHI